MPKDKYEISVWEDYVVPTSGNVPEHYEERKIGTIGSNTMTSPCRAFEPKLIENVNGTNTLTFKMYYLVADEDGTKYQNPFLNLMINERKIKAFWKNKWYDMIIKNIQEDSSGKSITYTCKDLYINELSKNGFALEFDSKLKDDTGAPFNQGTAIELATKVLEGTDWQISTTDSDTIQQELQEPVYECTATGFTAHNDTKDESITIPSGAKILIFYSQLVDIISGTATSGTIPTLQFCYAATYKTDDNSQLVINGDCCSKNSVSWTKNGTTLTLSGVGSPATLVSSTYRANRLIKEQKSVFDPLTKHYVKKYTAIANGTGTYAGLISKGDIIYGYQEVVYNDPTIVNNIIVNSKDFTSTEGWVKPAADTSGLVFQLYPTYSSATQFSTYNAKSYMRVGAYTYYNAGARQMSSYIPNGFQMGEKYIFRVKAMTNGTNMPSGTYVSSTDAFTPSVRQINEETTQPTGNTYFSIDSYAVLNNWLEYTLVCTKSCSRANIYTEKLGFFLTSNGTYWLEEVQFFPYHVGQNGRINPGELDQLSIATTNYKYYNATTQGALYDVNLLTYLHNSSTDWNYSGLLEPEYNDNFEKIRSISIKQSNRFNILQSIAETFECWMRFEIQHDQSTGRTIYIDGVPQKKVYIVKEIGQQTGIGFIYGIDLKTISRTIQSDQIVTKTIVSKNSNQYGKNGFCTIARATENYPRESFILNFDYYINQGLLDGGKINKDLYLNADMNHSNYPNQDGLGYYYNLNKLNTEYDQITDILIARKNELLKMEAYQKTYSEYKTSLQGQIQNLVNEIINIAGVNNIDEITTYLTQKPDDLTVATKVNAWQTAVASLAYYSEQLSKLEESISSLNVEISNKENRQKEIKTSLNRLNLLFYKKYSRFIQEGSWKSEDYIDDNLYYLDAVSVAYTSSRPQISYNISVLRISSIEGFENKVFHLGDISYVQDTEFFGYIEVGAGGIRTPYKEQVLVSEITSNFDSPELDTFKVQNYKTQFEDLFQRITSTTQSLQYASGSYAKAANIIEEDGTIKIETLQNSIITNQQLVYSARNESIVSDSTGITVSDETNPNNKTKITSGGVFTTTDGGETWKNAIKGGGVSTEYLTSGNINVDEIYILDSNRQTFRWDSNGISAFSRLTREGGEDIGINLSKYVRFNHLGVFGVDSIDDSMLETEDEIWANAKFGMTWKGFFVKNKYDGHTVEVSSENDIQVLKGTTPLIKIGQLDAEEDIYGIRISNASGAPVMETNNLGDLWLRNRLNISSTDDGFDIGIGYLDGTKPDTDIHEVVNANDKFIVYEDGSMKATDGEFTGTIYATGGKIGNMTIDEVEQSVYKVIIESNSGTIFKNGQGTKLLTAKLYEGDHEVTTGSFTYVWFKNDVQQSYSTKQISVTADSTDAVYTYTCRITYTPATT